MIDQLLFLFKKVANLEGMYILRKDNYFLSLETKHNLNFFSEFEEIKRRNQVVKMHKWH